MVRSLAFALAVAGLAASGTAYADPVKSDPRAQVTPAAYSANGPQVSEVVIINPRVRLVQAYDAPKPRIWVSMGF